MTSMNRISITKHCETIGNTVTATVDAIQVTAGKTAMVFTPYWYVKYHRNDKPDVVLFSNPLDWLGHLERLKPIDSWTLGNPHDAYDVNTPVFARLQWLTRGVERGFYFFNGEMTIWAEKHPITEKCRYGFSTGEKRHVYESVRRWKTAIKPYLWDWTLKEGVTNEQTA